MWMIGRRGFLKTVAAGSAAAVLCRARRSARADGTPRVKRILVLNAEGAMRNTMAFNASPLAELNPWGVIPASGAIRLGQVLMSEPSAVETRAPSWPGSPVVPSIVEMSSALTLVAGVDHSPGQFRAGDHVDDGLRMGTGYFGAPAPGLLTVLGRYLSSSAPLPVLSLGHTGYLGVAPGEWSAFAPVEFDPMAPPSGDATSTPARASSIEDALDASLRKRRGGLVGAALETYATSKRAMRKYDPRFVESQFALADPSQLGALSGGITNRMLLEAVGNSVTDDDCGHADGIAVALALRFLQQGAPAVAVGVPGFDTHSSEHAIVPELFTRFARYVAGIHFALSQIPDGNGTLLDTTLVVTTSEMGRSPGTASYDGHDGTDHGAAASWRYQSHLLFGAGVTPGVYSATDDQNQPTGAVISTQNLLATLCTSAGISALEVDSRWPPGTALRPEHDVLAGLWS
jgi:hypothetical protein